MKVIVTVALLPGVMILFPSLYFNILVALVKVIGIHLYLSYILHREKILLATKLARKMESVFGEKGRVHFNVGINPPVSRDIQRTA